MIKVFGGPPNLTLSDKRRVRSFVEKLCLLGRKEGAVSPCIWKHNNSHVKQILDVSNICGRHIACPEQYVASGMQAEAKTGTLWILPTPGRFQYLPSLS